MHTQTLHNPSQKKRVDYLDMLKCLGMFIVVSGHIHPDYKWFSLTVHCFVIPLYFLLSGMTFKRSKFPSLWKFIKHRAKTLLLPYLMFSLVTWAFWVIFNVASHNQVNLWSPLLQTFIAQGSGGFLVHNVPLWFLPCLFVIEVLYYMIDKLPEWANITVCILLSVLGACMISWWRGPFILLPWSMESAFVSILFYCAGNILVKHLGLVGIQDMVLGNRLFNAVMNYHLWYGRNSLYIMATHVPVKGIIILIIAKLIGKNEYFVTHDWWCLAIVFALTCAICSVLSLWIAKWKKMDEARVQKRILKKSY